MIVMRIVAITMLAAAFAAGGRATRGGIGVEAKKHADEERWPHPAMAGVECKSAAAAGVHDSRIKVIAAQARIAVAATRFVDPYS
jgi:hypothetical protein